MAGDIRVRGKWAGAWVGVGTRAMGWAKNIGWGSFYFFIYSFFLKLKLN